MNSKKDVKKEFVSLSKVIKEKSKDKKFKNLFSEEISTLKLAHEIRLLRQKRQMTQKQVAIRAEMPQSVIARLESGTHSFSIATLHKVARVFDRKVGLIK